MPHKSLDELQKQLHQWSQKIPLGSIWYHRKNPDILYEIKELVIDEPTDEVAIIYKQISSGVSFVRIASIFEEKVDYGNVWGPRFIQVS